MHHPDPTTCPHVNMHTCHLCAHIHYEGADQ
jgi:hypothetical protein